MTVKIIIISIIQGITEFLPISSSGHIILFGKILGINVDFLLLNIILHLGSLLAIIIFFFQDIKKILSNLSCKKNNLLYYIIAATIPTAIIGLFIKKNYNTMENPIFVSIMLLITAGLLFSTRFAKEKKDLNLFSSFIIGIAQGIATIPGISRSGATISLGLNLGIKREDAFRFSFLIVIPAIIGALLLEIIEILKTTSKLSASNDIIFWNYLLGFVLSFLTSLISLKILSFIIKKEKIYLFSYYCLITAIFGIIIGG